MSDVSAPVSELEARHLTRYFTVQGTRPPAGARRGSCGRSKTSALIYARVEVTAVVGESGSGKSVLARLLARILTPTSGELILRGTPIAAKARRSLAYASDVQLVLQDPFASMNPVHQISHNLDPPSSHSRRIEGRVARDSPRRRFAECP